MRTASILTGVVMAMALLVGLLYVCPVLEVFGVATGLLCAALGFCEQVFVRA